MYTKSRRLTTKEEKGDLKLLLLMFLLDFEEAAYYLVLIRTSPTPYYDVNLKYKITS